MIKTLFITASFMMFNSCARIPIKDAEFCGDLGSEGATCFHTLTNDQRDIMPADWPAERFGMVCTKAQTFADIKAAIEKLCSVSSIRCTYEINQIQAQVAKHVSAIQKLTTSK